MPLAISPDRLDDDDRGIPFFGDCFWVFSVAISSDRLDGDDRGAPFFGDCFWVLSLAITSDDRDDDGREETRVDEAVVRR